MEQGITAPEDGLALRNGRAAVDVIPRFVVPNLGTVIAAYAVQTKVIASHNNPGMLLIGKLIPIRCS